MTSSPSRFRPAPRLAGRSFALLCAAVLAFFVTACGGNTTSHDDHAGHTDTNAPLITGAPADSNAADVTFVTHMIPHHQQALELAALVPDRSTNAELKTLAQQIEAAQQPEISTMKAFLVQWNGGESAGAAPTTTMDHGGMAMNGMVDDATMAKLKTLQGAEFDKLWLQSMIAHHQGAVEMAKTELASGRNVDAKQLAQNIVSGQQAEIDQMQKMLAGQP
ncbi:MAG TPA: DUF305 domain-containing protein [Mycobacterium sp.]|nr:DUF305 domain-containing protein [Mycobacterium sp.]